jgi:xylulokinase
MAEYVMGIDVGTTGTKAMVFDMGGNIAGKGYREYKLDEPRPNWVEVGARFLVDITFEAAREAVADSGIDPSEIASVGFSVNRSSFCLVDAELNVIDDKVTIWLDSRSESLMDEINAKMSPERRNEITGMPGYNIFAVTKYYWIKKNEPEKYARAKYFASVDSLIMHAFGSDRFVAEISNATVTGLMDVRTLGWNMELADALGFDPEKFPPLCKPAEVVGVIKDDVAKKTGLAAGTKIVAGSGDQQLAAMGAGVIKDGAVSLTIGTFGLLAIGLAKPDFSALKGLMIPSSPTLGVFEVEGPQVSGATCYRWCRDTLCAEEIAEGEAEGVDPYALMDEKYLQKSAPGSNGVIFYSALFGSGYPTWDTNATGMFLGLRSTHTKADIVRAVIEGITLEARHILESVLAAGVVMDDTVTVTGGASKSKTWCQTLADVLARKIRTLVVSDAAVLGAAGLAAVGAGLIDGPGEFVRNMVKFGDSYEPIPANVEIYDKAFDIYKAAYYGLKERDVFAKLADLRSAR